MVLQLKIVLGFAVEMRLIKIWMGYVMEQIQMIMVNVMLNVMLQVTI